jgi:hypothetical protein
VNRWNYQASHGTAAAGASLAHLGPYGSGAIACVAQGYAGPQIWFSAVGAAFIIEQMPCSGVADSDPHESLNIE